ncbi:MAG: DeoR/GlpR family DNA-binding transcription regulator [Rhodoglobus sp.]
MSAHVRRQQLQRLIAERGFLRVADASAEFDVSDVTIRADLGVLEAEGGVVRVHGGAMPRSAVTDRESPIESTRERDATAKRAIGRATAALVGSGESVYLDVGSTALAVADALVARSDLHDLVVVTNGLTIALALEHAVPRFTVIVTGGTLRPLQHSLVNPYASGMLAALNVDVAIIGCNGVDPDRGVTNLNLPEAEVKRQVLASSRRHVLVADSSKLGRTELGVVGPVSDFEMLVTAGQVDAAVVEQLRRRGTDVLVADQ